MPYSINAATCKLANQCLSILIKPLHYPFHSEHFIPHHTSSSKPESYVSMSSAMNMFTAVVLGDGMLHTHKAFKAERKVW